MNGSKPLKNERKVQIMEIKKNVTVEQYRTNIGLDVFLKHYPDGTATVTSQDSVYGSSVFHGKYNTRRGALIAIGKLFGKVGFRFKSEYSEPV